MKLHASMFMHILIYLARYGTKSHYVFSVTAVTGDALLHKLHNTSV